VLIGPPCLNKVDLDLDLEGIGKKIDALAKQKDCQDAGLWRRSIVNHLNWIAATAPDGDGDMLEAMWKSVTNHIQDIHDGHCEVYPECAHGPLDEDERELESLSSDKISPKLLPLPRSAIEFSYGIPVAQCLCSTAYVTAEGYCFHRKWIFSRKSCFSS